MLSRSKNHIDHKNKNASRARTNGIYKMVIPKRIGTRAPPPETFGRGLPALFQPPW